MLVFCTKKSLENDRMINLIVTTCSGRQRMLLCRKLHYLATVNYQPWVVVASRADYTISDNVEKFAMPEAISCS